MACNQRAGADYKIQRILGVTFVNAFSLIVIVCGLVHDPEPVALPSKTQSQAVAQSPIELIEIESRKVAFIEHSGPYWSLGPVIDQVARDARAMGVRDGLVIRYLDDPVAASPAGLRAEVGFEFAGSDLPKPPYKLAQWPPALVARKSVNGPDGLSTRHFASLKAWAQSQGLAPAGDLIALVDLAEGGESTAIDHAEILLPVCVPDPPAVKTPPTFQKTHENETEPSKIQEAARTPRVVTKVIQLPVPNSQGGTAEASPPLALGTPVQQAPVQRLATPLAPLDVPTPQVQPSVPVRQWIEAGKFTELAGVVLPDKVDSASRQWADQMAARIVAVANGVQKQSPGEEGWLAELATQLADRREANRAESHKSIQRVIGPSVAVVSKDADRKALMLELDRLMANVSYRSLKPDQVRENLIQLLEKVPPLISP